MASTAEHKSEANFKVKPLEPCLTIAIGQCEEPLRFELSQNASGRGWPFETFDEGTPMVGNQAQAGVQESPGIL